ncbi:hypothetical protein LTR97_000477 [Elasticomyces elasticus]|uniref:Arginase n=1 Tax=Elasticomyces elasticus TaxID=574655 RepID=A0AAN7WHD8_9PEZI|nr:hypothetical protein LTR97_000477 [Elasticomyces elasticus]KAK5727088.1 hypothetical protein LTR15_002980 [Elasticomyces elasticus]
MRYESITVILSPYHVGVPNQGVGAGPKRVLDAGLVWYLEKQQVAVRSLTIPPVDDFQGEIGRGFELMRRIADIVRSARHEKSFPVVLAGNCFSSVGVSSGIDDIPHEELGMIWHDAHDDYHTPDTLTSGYFDAMGVSMLTGESWHALTASIPGFAPLRAENVIFCGVRDVTQVEGQRLEEAGFKIVWGDPSGMTHPAYAQDLEAILQELTAPRHAMIHWDLDSLDSEVCGEANRFAAPGGLTEDDLVGIGEMLPERVFPASLTVASFDPSYSADNGAVIARIAVRSIETLVRSMVANGLLSKVGQ